MAATLYEMLSGIKTGSECCSKKEIVFDNDEEFDTCLVNIGEESSDCQCGNCQDCFVASQPKLPDTPRPGAKANKSEENALALTRAVEGINCPACIKIRKSGRSTSGGCWYHDILGFEDYYQA